VNGRLAMQVQRTLAEQAGASTFRQLRAHPGGDLVEPVRQARKAATRRTRAKRAQVARRLFPDAPRRSLGLRAGDTS
jgi:hypothetical protein